MAHPTGESESETLRLTASEVGAKRREPCGKNEGPQPDTDEIPNLERGQNRDCHQCDRPDIICARNTGRDRA